MPRQGMIKKEGTVLVVIDVQEKLFPHIAEKERIIKNIEKLIRFAKIIKVPIILTEQYPKGLGPTLPIIRELLPDLYPIEKVEFSCMESERFKERLTEKGAQVLILVGIETHICVTQTAIEAIESGYEVYVVSDAVSSRNLYDKEVALERIRHTGIIVVSTEMLIYEMLRKAGTADFKATLELVK